MNTPFPRMMQIRQKFYPSPPLSLDVELKQQIKDQGVAGNIKPGSRIAVAVGSRGITHIKEIVSGVLKLLQEAGAKPFIIPAMGSHGGATPGGQAAVLAEYGITPESMGVPIAASLEVRQIGFTDDGVEVCVSTEALNADGIVIVNRIKPHTDFSGSLGSGIMKMMVIGLGKRVGASNYHAAASRFGYEQALRAAARVILKNAPILCGVAVIENQRHETAGLHVLRREEIEQRENELFVTAKKWMPRLPFDEIDLLIVDRIGKNISGSGMDPNITGRWVHGYSSLLADQRQSSPVVRRLFVRGLTEETRGNAIGIGIADITTRRLVEAMDREATYINAWTSTTPNTAKIPIYYDSDREAIEFALGSLGLSDTRQAKIIRIADTLSLEQVEVSEAFAEPVGKRDDLQNVHELAEMQFDVDGNLID